MIEILNENWGKIIFISVLALEFYMPFYLAEKDNFKRFFENLGHVIIANIVIITALGMLGYSLKYLDHTILSKGIISSLNIGYFFKLLISFIILDLAIYWQHRLSHKIPFLWAFHQVHHQDTSFSASTALRFHFGEIFYSLIYKIIIISLLGIPLNIFLAFEVFLFSCASFNHSNLRLPKKLENFLDFIFVTPKFHRVHHSVEEKEQQSNYSFSVPVWDFIFRSHTPKKEIESVGLSYGDSVVNESRTFIDQLKTPFLYLKKLK